MQPVQRIESALDIAISQADAPGCPPRLAEALRYAVFPGGHRIRPRLCLAVAWACGDDDPGTADAAASAIELLHCASLVHDDLPCFDDAETRRGRPSVHRAYGEQLAVLAGDALIVLAFETLARGTTRTPSRLAPLVRIVGRAVGAPWGIVAGQAWETEAHVDLDQYHRAKTGSLFAAATVAGAAAAGAEAEPWARLGERVGAAYQVADDIRDIVCTEEEIGKPVGRDAALARPSAAHTLGLEGAIRRLSQLTQEAVESIPECRHRLALQQLVRQEATQFLPKELARRAA